MLGKKPRAGERAWIAAAPGGLPSCPGREGSSEPCLPTPLPSKMRSPCRPVCILQSCSCLEQQEISNHGSFCGRQPKPTGVDAPLHTGSQKAKGRDGTLSWKGLRQLVQGRWPGTVLQLPTRFGGSLSLWVSVSLGVQAGHQLCKHVGYREVTLGGLDLSSLPRPSYLARHGSVTSTLDLKRS